jgi:hypothetical protein
VNGKLELLTARSDEQILRALPHEFIAAEQTMTSDLEIAFRDEAVLRTVAMIVGAPEQHA